MKKPLLFTGAATAIITPFNDDAGKTVNYDKLAELVEAQITGGIDAIVVCGTTGEASTLTDEEHISVIKFVVKKTNSRVPVIAGVGSNDTRHAVELSQKAEQVGADGLLSVLPYYNKTSQAGLVEHYTIIAKSVKLPIIIYNVPTRTGCNITPATLQKLAKLDNIVGVKECNFSQVGDIVNLCGDDFAVYSGDDNVILPVLSLGGLGIISVMSNIIPNDVHDMVVKFLDCNLQGAKKIQLKTLPLINALFADVSPMPLKAAMNILGKNVGTCRLPLVDVDPALKTKLEEALKNYGLI